MYLKIVVISFIVAIPVFMLGALLEMGASVEALADVSFWSAHIYTLLSYVIVAVLVHFLANLSFAGLPSLKAAPATPSEDKEHGQVKWFNSSKGYGFITREQGDDVFVHYRSIIGKGHRALYEGQEVAFVVTEGDKGLQADEVDILSGGPNKRSRRR